jgi:hypothetical protein
VSLFATLKCTRALSKLHLKSSSVTVYSPFCGRHFRPSPFSTHSHVISPRDTSTPEDRNGDEIRTD